MKQTTARAHSNIAFIKYWGNRDEALRIPVNGSLSMNLAGLYAQTTVEWRENLESDELILNGKRAQGAALERVSAHLDVIRQRGQMTLRAQVESTNNFPMGTGIASSAAAFAALTVAGCAAAGLSLTERELTTIARIGSGSASRSVPTGFVEWYAGDSHDTSFAESIAPPDHWELVDVIALVSSAHKAIGSRQGHTSAGTSDLQSARVTGADARIEACRTALLERDFTAFADVVEHDSNLMHAVMMTSRPPLFYWLPPTLTIMQAVRDWRTEGIAVCYTLDAGPNVHCLCLQTHAKEVEARLRRIQGVEDVLVAGPGQGARIISAG